MRHPSDTRLGSTFNVLVCGCIVAVGVRLVSTATGTARLIAVLVTLLGTGMLVVFLFRWLRAWRR